MKYIEYTKKRQEKLSKLPFKAAYGEKQFEQMMEEWGLTKKAEDIQKICSLGGGCYCLKKDFHIFVEFSERIDIEDKEFYSKDENLKDALIYEFGNHECGLTGRYRDGITALGFSVQDFLSDEHKAEVAVEAKKEYLKIYEG